MKCPHTTHLSHACIVTHHQPNFYLQTDATKYSANNCNQHNYEQKFAEILQSQLKSLNELKQEQIQGLSQTISQLKSHILKLEHRNKLDKENQEKIFNELTDKNQIIEQLQQKIRMCENKNQKYQKSSSSLNKQTHYGRRVGANDQQFLKIQQLQDQIRQLKQKIAGLNGKLAEKDQYYLSLEQNLRLDIVKLQSKLRAYNNQNNELQSMIDFKDKQILSLEKDIKFLEEKVEIISEKPMKKYDQPLIIHKIQHEPPQIKQIYVEKPIEKTVFMETQKVVKQFIQPERPIITRMINCATQKQNCKCEEVQTNTEKDIHNERFQECFEQFQNVIKSYKSERNQLVDQIRNRNSDINLLEKKIQLCQKNTQSKRSNQDCQIEVTVVKDDLSSSQNSQKNPRIAEKSKIMPKKTQQFTRNVPNTKKNELLIVISY